MKMHRARTFLRVVAVLAVVVTCASLAQAQTCSITWTGNVDYWDNPDNWRPRQVPGPTDDVCIPSGEADARTTPSISVNSIQLNQGAVLVFGTGTVSIATSLTAQGGVSVLGTTLSATSVNVPSGGSLTGNGTIEGSLTNSGYLSPQAASITVTGNFTQTATGEVGEIWDSPGILNVNGNATLSGYLYVNYDPKKPPKPGATYTVMTFGSLSGAFTSISPGTAKYTNNSVVVKF